MAWALGIYDSPLFLASAGICPLPRPSSPLSSTLPLPRLARAADLNCSPLWRRQQGELRGGSAKRGAERSLAERLFSLHRNRLGQIGCGSPGTWLHGATERTRSDRTNSENCSCSPGMPAHGAG
jgi:hypothetical protein